MDVELTQADTECAQALLDLASSSASVKAIQQQFHEKKSPDYHKSFKPLGSNKLRKSPQKRGNTSANGFKKIFGRGSPPKRGRGRGRAVKSYDHYPYYSSLVMNEVGCTNQAETREEIVRRVGLDHTYASPHGPHPPIPSAFYELLDEVEAKKHEGFILEKKENFIHSDASSLEKSNKCNGNLKKEVESIKQDLYQPFDDKYKNFNLLLKCLTNDSPEDKGATRKRCFSQNSSQGSAKSPHAVQHSGNFYSVASAKARLNTAESTNSETITCPTCSLAVTKQKLEQHLVFCLKNVKTCPYCLLPVENKNLKNHACMCFASSQNVDVRADGNRHDRSNTATCQFCGVRMRRQMLVQHLAHNHCIDNREQLQADNDGSLSDSGSSTLSGNSVQCEGTDNRITKCHICSAYVLKLMLTEHLAEKHFNVLSRTGYVSQLNENIIEDTETKSDTNSNSIIVNNNQLYLKPSTEKREDKNYILQKFLGINTMDTEQFQKEKDLIVSLAEKGNTPVGVMQAFSSIKHPSHTGEHYDNAQELGLSDNGQYTLVVRRDSSNLHSTIQSLAERINPKLQVLTQSN